MNLEVLHALNAERASRRAVVLVTDVTSGEQRLVKAAGVAKDPSERCAGKALAYGQERHGGDGARALFPYRLCAVAAACHHRRSAYQPDARANWATAGYDVTIVDPRTAFASIERFPDVKVIAEWPDVALPPLGIDHYTAFVALTHDPKIDDPALKHALARDCFYIGALGSKKTHAKRVDRLKQAGLTEADIARIHAPIGLNIEAISPAEIAVAIMGEITQVLRQKAEAA